MPRDSESRHLFSRTPRRRSWLAVLGMVAGGIGVAACLIALVLVWIASARFRESTDVLFDKMNGSLDVVGQRLVQARDGIDGATQSADQLEAKLRDG